MDKFSTPKIIFIAVEKVELLYTPTKIHKIPTTRLNHVQNFSFSISNHINFFGVGFFWDIVHCL